MIKNNKESKNPLRSQENYTYYYKEVRHIISELYRIREVNRKKPYDIAEVKKLVLGSPVGIEVKKKLNEKKVTEEWLDENGFDKVAEVYESELFTK